MKALIENNRVIDLVEEAFDVAPSMSWKDAPEGCRTGWLLEDGALNAPVFTPLTYAEERQKAYPSIVDQADMQYWDAVNGTTTWQDAIAAVKDAHPKP